MPEIPLARGWLKARGCGGQVAGCEAVRLRAGRCKFFVIFFDGILKIPESQCFLRGIVWGAFIASVFFQFGFAIFFANVLEFWLGDGGGLQILTKWANSKSPLGVF